MAPLWFETIHHFWQDMVPYKACYTNSLLINGCRSQYEGTYPFVSVTDYGPHPFYKCETKSSKMSTIKFQWAAVNIYSATHFSSWALANVNSLTVAFLLLWLPESIASHNKTLALYLTIAVKNKDHTYLGRNVLNMPCVCSADIYFVRAVDVWSKKNEEDRKSRLFWKFKNQLNPLLLAFTLLGLSLKNH